MDAICQLYCIYWNLLRLLSKYRYIYICTQVDDISGDPVFCTVNLIKVSRTHLILMLYFCKMLLAFLLVIGML